MKEPSKAAAEGFEILRLLNLFKVIKTCHVAVSKPNRKSLQGLCREVPWCRMDEPSKAAAQGFELLSLLMLLKVPETCHVAA